MPAPVSVDEFLELMCRSEILEAPHLETYLKLLQTRGLLPVDLTVLSAQMVHDGLLTPYQAELLLQGRPQGLTLGNFFILGRIGAGGMGLVYLGQHKVLRHRVALKLLRTAQAQREETLKRFYREARANAVLDHPHVVRTFDVEREGNLHYLVMEYVEGSLLQDIVERCGPLEVRRAAHYVRQAAIGLQHAHQAGLVHRDIKPANLILDRSGTIKILDLGLARFVADEQDILTEMVLGTPDYIAPEQTEDSHLVDIRADVYSLGCTFYFLLTGAPPFGEGTVAQKLLWHQNRRPTPVRARRPEVPADLALAVETMMAKERGQRYQSPAAVIEALAPWTQEPIPLPSEEEMPRRIPSVWPVTKAAAGSSATAHLAPSRPTKLG